MSEEIKGKKKRKKVKKKVPKKAVKTTGRKKKALFKLPKPQFRFVVPDKKRVRMGVFATAFVLILVFAAFYVKEKYTVVDIVVEGSTHYSKEEIEDMVLGDGILSHNSLFLSIKYNDKEIKDVPFVETMNVRILSPSSIKITVYEKAIAGFVEQLSRYIYFDKDGTVVESSDVMTAGIPQIIGMKFDYFVLNEKLPVEDEKIFKKILETSQLLNKYDIKIEKIFFDDNYNLTLYIKKVEIKLGSFDNIDEKIIRLKKILPEIEDKSGVLRLENYEEGTVITTFEYND